MSLDRALKDDQGSATDFDMALKVFSGEVLNTFTAMTRAFDLTTKKPAQGHKTEQFPALANSATAEGHVPGGDIVGQTLEKEERTVSLEDRERIAFYNMTTIDKFLAQYDYQMQLGRDAGRALAYDVENHVLRLAVAAAKTAARGSFPGGQQLTTKRTTSIATAYPMSLAGSQALQDDIGELVQKFKEDNVPTDDMYLFMRPREVRVLRQDNTLLSSDYTDRAFADKLSGRLLKVENCWIIESNHMPTGTDYSAATDPLINGSGAYQADCTYVAGIIMRPGALASLLGEGITPSVDWIPDKRVWQVGAAMYKGHGYLRPECVGIIEAAAS